MKNTIAIILLMLLFSVTCIAQNRNSVWCFGDSALIDFSDTVNPVVGESGMDGRGSCVSVCNESGELLFYGNTRALPMVSINSTIIYDSTHSVMQNGDSITGRGWYQELVIIPDPKNDSTYYLFTVGVTSVFGFYYSKIDMKLNNGLGAVTQKNIQINGIEQTDCLSAIKHGNGKDWWIVTRPSNFSTGGSNNQWYVYFMSSDTLQAMPVQSIGQLNVTNSGRLCFSTVGDKLVFTNLLGVVDVFDFDRCTGLLSNLLEVDTGVTVPPAPFNWSCEFSPDGSKLYISTDDTLCYLFQYDLNAINISASKDTLLSTNYPKYTLGALKLAPDNKIYLCNQYTNNSFTYPYPDSLYNMYNMNLSVINSPDSLGTACNFQPYSFYLGGKRAYKGLPNNPNYDMQALLGSPCDTLVGFSEHRPTIINPELHVYYHSQWQTAFINANNLSGTKGTLKIFDVEGKLVHREEVQIVNGYYTRNFNMTGMAEGMYVVNIISSGQRLSGKLVKY